MKKKITPNKAEKYQEEEYWTRAETKSKEQRKLTSSLYSRDLPTKKKRKSKSRGK